MWVTDYGGVCHSAMRSTLRIEELFIISLSNSPISWAAISSPERRHLNR